MRPPRRWAGALAGVTLLALSFAAGAALRAQTKPGDVGFPYGDLREVTLSGKLVSLQAELPRKYGARANGAREPQMALATPEGRYYTFVDNDRYRGLLTEHPAGQAVEVRARLFPRSQLLELLSVKELPAESIHRRFHCSVCNIDADDFGPCACCGRELELVPTK